MEMSKKQKNNTPFIQDIVLQKKIYKLNSIDVIKMNMKSHLYKLL